MATKLPSGSYRTQVFVGYDKGKRVYKSFVAETAKKADLLALQWQAEHPSDVSGKTLESCIDAFLRAKRPVLSPSTIRGYVSIQTRLKDDFKPLVVRRIHTITGDDMQGLINKLYEDSSAKTVRNYYGFLSAVFRANGLSIPFAHCLAGQDPNSTSLTRQQ